jgi:hypothetical protein
MPRWCHAKYTMNDFHHRFEANISQSCERKPKQVITKNEQFDFLNDIVSKVADAHEKSETGGVVEPDRPCPGAGGEKTFCRGRDGEG